MFFATTPTGNFENRPWICPTSSQVSLDTTKTTKCLIDIDNWQSMACLQFFHHLRPYGQGKQPRGGKKMDRTDPATAFLRIPLKSPGIGQE
jgi:hypothetical protein